MPEWLPALLEFNEPGAPWDGDWQRYVEEVYRVFQMSLAEPIRSRKLLWRGIRMGLKRYPESLRKEATFWHMVSEGEIEEDREPALDRCARIRWPGAMIPRSVDPLILTWMKEIKGKQRIHMYLPEERYLLVLDYRCSEDGDEYILPWTAYPVSRDHFHRKLLQAYETWKKQGPPLPRTP